MEEDFDCINKGISLSRDLSSLMEADHPAQGERWSPDESGEDTSELTPQADRTETQAKRDRESTGRTPAPQLKKQRNEDYGLTDSPLKEGFYRPAVASGDWQPSMPAVVEDEEMVGQPASYTVLVGQDERDEELLEVPNPQKVRLCAPDRMRLVGEDPTCQDQERDLLQGAT
eukprot:7678910-Pyramimonas_sp.AAC.1